MPGFHDPYGMPLVQTGSSFSGSRYTGMFGTPTSSPAFGVSSSSPAFGASSSPAFGVSSSPSGAFGQSSCRPFGSPSGFEHTNNEDKDPLVAPKPFGNTSPFDAQTGSSFFGVSSSPAFGASSSPAFGASSLPAFGATSHPAFGASSSPAFRASSHPAFGASSSPAFRASSHPAFGASSSAAFGASSSPAFGASSSPSGPFGLSSSSPFGSASVFGHTHNADSDQFAPFGGFGSPTNPFGSSFQQSQHAFGSTPFGSTPFRDSCQPPFHASSRPAFGSSTTPAFGVSNSSVFGSNTPAFGASSTPAFGSLPTPAFGTTSSAFDGQQSAEAFGSTLFGTAPTAFGAQPSPFGRSLATTPACGSPGFGQTSCGCQFKGSRVTPYAQTRSEDGYYDPWNAKNLQSISAMPAYKEKTHEELRREDYQALDKGQSTSTSSSSVIKDSGRFTYSPAFCGIPINPFTPKTWSTNNTQQQHSNLFSSSPAFGQEKAGTLCVTCSFNPVRSTSPPSQPIPFAFNSTPTFSSTPSSSLFGTSNVSNSSVSISLNFSSTQSSPLFHSPPTSLFGQNRQASRNSIVQITINNPTTVSEQPTVVKISVPTNQSPCLNLEIEKLMNLRI